MFQTNSKTSQGADKLLPFFIINFQNIGNLFQNFNRGNKVQEDHLQVLLNLKFQSEFRKNFFF